MSWSYSGNPASSDLDQVRFYVSDTDSARPLLADEEIAFLLAQWKPAYDSPLYVSAVACEVIAGKFASEVNVSADGANVDSGSLQQKYLLLANSLRSQYRNLYAMSSPDISELMALDWDPDLVPLTFGTGFMDNLRAGTQEYGNVRGPGKWGPYAYPETPGW